MAVPWSPLIGLAGKIFEKLIEIPGRGRRNHQKEALIAALITSIPILTKELIPVVIEAVRSLGRRPKTYYVDDSDVCHVYEDCTVGSKINPEHRKRGTGNKELCIQCRDRMLGLG